MEPTIELVSKTCRCGRTFRVLPNSTQEHCNKRCIDEDPDYKPKEKTVSSRLDVKKLIKSAASGAPLTLPKVESPQQLGKVYKSERKRLEEFVAKPEEEKSPEEAWNNAVEQAKTLVGQMKTTRLKIAEIALSVCEVQYGGNWRAFARIHTVKNFAKDIDVHPKTLHQWIRVKRNIHDQLPDGEWVDDWGLAVRVDAKVGAKPTKEKVLDAYRKEKNRNKPERRLRTVSRAMTNFVHLLQKKDVLKSVAKEDLVEAYENVSVLKRTLKEKISGYK